MANEWSRSTVTLDPPGQSHTIDNLMNAIDSFLTQLGWVEPAWSVDPDNRFFVRTDVASRERWQYVGDGPLQACGIRISKETGDTEVWVSTFIENQAGNGSQIDTRDAGVLTGGSNRNLVPYITIIFDTTAPNNYLFVGGEDGFYIEAGRDGQPNNLGQGSVLTFAAVPELNATKDNLVQHMGQGLPMDLSGTCRFTEARDIRFVTNDGTNRNFTAWLYLRATRGLLNITQAASPADNPVIRFGSRDSIFGLWAFTGGSNQDVRYGCTFGLLNTPEDERFRMSPLTTFQETLSWLTQAQSSSASNTLAPSPSGHRSSDIRHVRQMLRWVVIDYTLIPFINVSDAGTGTIYRVVEHNDGGRIAKLGIEWPVSSITVSIL